MFNKCSKQREKHNICGLDYSNTQHVVFFLDTDMREYYKKIVDKDVDSTPPPFK